MDEEQHAENESGVKSLSEVLRENLDSEFSAQCENEIKVLSDAVECHVRMCIAEKQTQIRCEREKRLHIESQLKQALNILDTVRGEIESTKQNHSGVLERLRSKKAQLKNDKIRLSKELANMENENARLALMRKQADQVDEKISQMKEYCGQHHEEKLQVQSQKEDGEKDRDALEKQLMDARVMLKQQRTNENTLRERYSQRNAEPSHEVATTDTNNNNNAATTSANKVTNASLINKTILDAIESTIKKAIVVRPNQVVTNKGNASSSKNEGNEMNQSELQKRVAALLLQNEQKSIAELNSRMNKHISTLTNLLENMPSTKKEQASKSSASTQKK